MGDGSGSIRNLTFDGLSFRVAFDANINLQISPYENEAIASSGRSMIKKTLRSPNAEGVTVLANPLEQEQLRSLSERLEPFPMSVELADGSIYRTTGWIDYPGVETEENRAELMIIPDRAIDAWSLFAAG